MALGYFTAGEVVADYVELGRKKASYPIWKMILLAILSGAFVAVTATACMTLSSVLKDPGQQRLVSGLLFPFALCIVLTLGTELFTSGNLLTFGLLAGKISPMAMLKSWLFVYIGNFIGSFAVAWVNLSIGQFGFGDGALALYTLKTAVGKCGYSFGPAVLMGIMCNLMVCGGVLMACAGKSLSGRLLACYMPIALFVICGFEHSVANMYYIPAGLLVKSVPEYANMAMQAGISLDSLTWGSFLGNNLLPVTIGNILGGVGLAVILWFTQGKAEYNSRQKAEAAKA